MNIELDPRAFTLDEWRTRQGARPGHVTVDGVTYTDLTEVEWREAHHAWDQLTAP